MPSSRPLAQIPNHLRIAPVVAEPVQPPGVKRGGRRRLNGLGQRLGALTIAEEQARASGKPDNILAKIADGKVEAYVKDVTLMNQPWVRDPSKTIGELITEKIASIKENISIRRFSRFKMGEGIEKKADDFAAEVASMVG